MKRRSVTERPEASLVARLDEVPMTPSERRDAVHALAVVEVERLHLMADCGGRNVQFHCCPLEAQVPGSRFERAQRIERGQANRHDGRVG